MDTNKRQKTIVLDGYSLSMDKIIEFIENRTITVKISNEARKRVSFTRDQVEKWLREDNKVIYGVTTGLGKLKDFSVSEEDQQVFQKNILRSHAAGVGDCFHDDIVRLSMLLRANVFCRGNSGVRVELIERILMFLNKGIYPRMPQVGSLGVGDLQPMAHLGLALSGMEGGEVKYNGEIHSVSYILKNASIEPLEFNFQAREALALMSGSTVLLAASIYAYCKARKIIILADAALALNLEAIRGEKDAFDDRIQIARGINTQILTAQNIRNLTYGSEWMTPKGRIRLGENKPRVQDAVSFRSSPQVHGAVRDVLTYIYSILSREMNASTDNPLLFCNDNGEFESLSGGNYHGAILSYSVDFMSIVLTDLGVLSERRSSRLLDPVMSYGLPSNLVGDSIGLNTGFALVQANAVALVGEMRVLSSPSSIGSIPSKSNQEDHNSMGMGGVHKLLKIIDDLKIVVAIEMLCAAQAIDLIKDKMKGLELGTGTKEIYEIIRGKVNAVYEDVYSREIIVSMISLMDNDELLKCIENFANY
ncbi:histidine ammonia-lyase [Clostridium sp. DJ247]|uniref:HAL/PAL/TAL family ammonia-lyase n=1 Tax=Clostridium sp. DJ247 TaxID=2726188 RepID=UPI001628AB12|nr:aromatic amino acid ammonia-lyase [Clostridium sp. DJ247]MBC2582635.1 aromatic amino acid lyase [Clostridium sp. DJ247]